MDSDDVPSGGTALPEATPAPATTSHPSTASASVSASAAAAGVTVAVNPPTTSAVVSGMTSTTAAAASAGPSAVPPSRYESQKRRDWNTFLEYLRNHKPPLALGRCSGAHVIEFLKYLDQFGKTKVHVVGCDFFGHPAPPASCACPLRQAWGSLDALIGRLRAAYEENGGRPESNPFGARAVRIYLREVRESQAKARGIPYEKKKRKRHPPPPPPPDTTDTAAETSSSSLPPATAAAGSSSGGGGEEDVGPTPPAEGTSS